MALLEVVLILIVIGMLLWLINRYLPIQPPILTIINVVVILAIVLWLLGMFFPALWNVRVSK